MSNVARNGELSRGLIIKGHASQMMEFKFALRTIVRWGKKSFTQGGEKMKMEGSNGNKVFRWGNCLCNETRQTLKKNDEFSFVFTEFKGSEGHLVGIQIPRK